MLFIKCSRSVYRNPINTEVSAVVMLHHMALLADHANGRIRRERVFRDHNDLLVGYIKICNFMSDHFFFNSGTVRSVLLTEFTAAATCCRSLCFWLLAIPSVTAEQNYFSGLHFTHKCLHFRLREISLFCFSQYFCHCFRQDIILASESVLYAVRIHEVICIDHLWFKKGRVQGGT